MGSRDDRHLMRYSLLAALAFVFLFYFVVLIKLKLHHAKSINEDANTNVVLVSKMIGQGVYTQQPASYQQTHQALQTANVYIQTQQPSERDPGLFDFFATGYCEGFVLTMCLPPLTGYMLSNVYKTNWKCCWIFMTLGQTVGLFIFFIGLLVIGLSREIGIGSVIYIFVLGSFVGCSLFGQPLLWIKIRQKYLSKSKEKESFCLACLIIHYLTPCAAGQMYSYSSIHKL